MLLLALVLLTSCERIAPNYYGVLMENYGKNGKDDYSKQQGRVNVMSPGTELFQLPAFEQRADFSNDGNSNLLNLKASDNTAFTAKPLYSYKVMLDRVVDVVFQNARLGGGSEIEMKALEDNVLEPHIYDLIKEESRKYLTDSLMASGGSLKFEQRKINELEELRAQQNVIRSRGITQQLLQEQAITKWNGVLPTTVTGNSSTVMNIPLK